jgi:hypothetical protein
MAADLVLILGAGASVPYGFPTGNELKNWICDMWTYRDRAVATYDIDTNPNPVTVAPAAKSFATI